MSIASFIDHTILRPTTTPADVDTLCAEAVEYGFAAVCLPPYYVRDAARLLRQQLPKVATVIGFPFGYSHCKAKLAEAAQAIEDGADELDMVINLAALRSNDLAYLESEIEAIVSLTKQQGRVLKVIIESGILSREEIIRCCNLYSQFPVDFLKTSTGYAEQGATVEAVQIMRQHLPGTIQIKASGGIRNYALAKAMIDAGATRLGCSAGVAIVREEQGLDKGKGAGGY